MIEINVWAFGAALLGILVGIFIFVPNKELSIRFVAGTVLCAFSCLAMGHFYGYRKGLGSPASIENLKTHQEFTISVLNSDNSAKIATDNEERFIRDFPKIPGLEQGSEFIVMPDESGNKKISLLIKETIRRKP